MTNFAADSLEMKMHTYMLSTYQKIRNFLSSCELSALEMNKPYWNEHGYKNRFAERNGFISIPRFKFHQYRCAYLRINLECCALLEMPEKLSHPLWCIRYI